MDVLPVELTLKKVVMENGYPWDLALVITSGAFDVEWISDCGPYSVERTLRS
jgi:hypothetical protein